MMLSNFYGIAEPEQPPRPISTVDCMAKAVLQTPGGSRSTWSNFGSPIAVGGLFAKSSQRMGGWALNRRAELLCLLEGEALNAATETRLNARDILAAYLEEGPSCLLSMEGSFNVLWWHRDDDRLLIATERSGYRHMYYRVEQGRLIFSSRMAAIVAGARHALEINPEILSAFLSFRSVPGNGTLIDGVEILPPASILTWSNGRVSQQRYWRLDDVQTEGRYDGRRKKTLEEVFRAAVRSAFSPGGHRVLGLTGGLDSRCVLSAALAERCDFSVMTDGVSSSTDLELARRLARTAHVDHAFHRTDPTALGPWLTLMVRLQGGTVATLQSHPCRYLFDPPSNEGLVLGMAGEPARGGSSGLGELGLSDRQQVADFIEQKIRFSFARQQEEFVSLWRTEYRSMAGSAPRAQLEQALDSYDFTDSVAEVIGCFELEYYARRFLTKATLIVNSALPVRLPYLDSRWLTEIYSLPLSVRVSGLVQHDLIQRLNPTLLEVPFDSAKPVHHAPGLLPGLRVRVTRGMKRIGRRMGVPKKTSRGKPAFRYGEWSRTEMRGVLRGLLYSPDAAHREYLRWEALKDRLDAHFTGEKDRTQLISGLAVLEIVHKLWICPSSISHPETESSGDQNGMMLLE